MRPGSFALSLLAAPLSLRILEALGEGPRSLKDLRQVAGAPSPTTMRKQLQSFTDLGIVLRRRQPEFPGVAEYELRPAGWELLEIREMLQDWLTASPQGPLSLGDVAAKNVVKALVEGWSSKIIRAIAVRPRTLTDLSLLIAGLNYPSLERRLSALRLCGLIEPRPCEGRGTPYGPSRWLRRACGPLTAAAQWERRHAAAEVAGERFDFESVFLLSILGSSLSGEASGRCRLGVELRNSSGEPVVAGVQLQVVDGEVRSAAESEGETDASASGPSTAWGEALLSGRLDDLYLSGDCRLGREVVEGMHRELFGIQEAVPAH